MIGACLRVLAVFAALSLVSTAAQTPTLTIVSPAADDILAGSTRLEAVVSPDDLASKVQTLTFFVDGRSVCTVEQRALPVHLGSRQCRPRPPHPRGRDARGGRRRLVANLHTKDLGYAERVRTEAVLVPVIVTDGGQFVRGLKLQDFEVFEDGIRSRSPASSTRSRRSTWCLRSTSAAAWSTRWTR